ncbi:MAG: nucleotide exchange factor GrpE [Thermodesulfobacteriota bacterium]
MTEKNTTIEDVLDAEMQAGAGNGEKGANGQLPGGEPEESAADELAQARAQVTELQDKLLRLAAEFENYRKRMERDRSIALKYAEEPVLKELLPFIDNLERAIEQGRKTHNADDLLAGVELICKGLLTTLEKFSLAPLASIGQPFDPNIHEALAVEASSEVEPNCVLREFEKGYMYKDRLIRPAKVVVAKKDETAAEQPV